MQSKNITVIHYGINNLILFNNSIEEQPHLASGLCSHVS